MSLLNLLENSYLFLKFEEMQLQGIGSNYLGIYYLRKRVPA